MRERVFEFLMKVVKMCRRIINVTASERFDIFSEKGQILCFRKAKGIFPEIYSMSIFIFAVTRLLIVGARKFFLLPKVLGVLQVFMT